MSLSAAAEKDIGRTLHPMLVAMIVSLAAFMEVLDTTITNVSLPHIAGSLAASPDESTWILTAYLVANGIVLPISGWLADVIGRKTFFILCIGGFTVASLACGMATSLPMLIVFRLIQGLAGGGLQPTQQAIIMDSFPPEKRGTAFAVTGITMIVAPVLGPTLGGYITDNFSWRWIFFMNVPVGIMAVLLVKEFVFDSPHAKAHGFRSVDYIGLGLIALGLGSLQVILDKGQEDDWFSSHFILFFATVAAICLTCAVFWLLSRKNPIVDLRLLKNAAFGPACLFMFVVGFSLYGAATMLPLLLQTQFGYDATLAGMVLSPGAVAIIFLMPIVAKLVNRVQARYLIAVGMGSIAVGMTVMRHFTPQTDYDTFVLMRILQVAGLPFLFVPISTMAFSKIPNEKNNKASALYSLMRNLGGSFGIAMLLSFRTRHEQAHQTLLAQHLSPANIAYRPAFDHAVATLMAHGQTHAVAIHMAMGAMYKQLLAQATMLSYGDAFGLLAGVTALFAIAALFLPRNELHGKASGEPVAAH
ncbi:MAG: DHA2 family efflux MFS transporter permease subunit [Alphaproteobacteria bacterium]|nr:DHA2 family efflux MFS transporter permease subunit [Alphaproteobacteria bacterium]